MWLRNLDHPYQFITHALADLGVSNVDTEAHRSNREAIRRDLVNEALETSRTLASVRSRLGGIF